MVDCELPSRFELSTLAGPNYHFPFLSIGSCFLVGTEKNPSPVMFIHVYKWLRIWLSFHKWIYKL